jgi:RNA polymerase sigma-70 factor (ECF subfamily)
MATRVSELGNGLARGGLGTYADLDDRMLVLDFQAGNEGAFSEIHRRYSGLARHVCQRILRNADDADEATQEAMLRVYQGLTRFNGRYALQPWVARIATNVSLDVTRARMRRPQTGDRTLMDLHEELRGHSDDPLEALERGLERERVNEVLASLPEHHREALILREFEGRSHQEIGERLDLTPSQAKALIHRAKGSFRRAWENAKARGLAVLAPIFLAPFKVPQLFRRLMLPSQELAASAAAAPAVTTSVVTTGERVTAAAVAVLITGSAAVGAVALKQPEHKPKPVVSQSVQVTVPTTSPEPVVAVPRRQQEERDPRARLIPPVAESPSAASETPSPSPTESPSPSETPPPTESPIPTIPPPPPWSLLFSSSVPIGWWQPKVESVTVNGTAGHRLAFSEEISVRAATAKSSTGRLYVGLSGSAQGATGKVSLSIILETSEGQFVYQAPGRLTEFTEGEDSRVDYTFTGSYFPVGWPVADDGSALVTADVPHDGTFRLDLRFWGDGTSLYEVGLALQESGL